MKSIITTIIIAGLTANLNANNLPKSDKMDRVYTYNELPKSDKMDRVYSSKECKTLQIKVNNKRSKLHNLIGATIHKDKYESMIRELLRLKKELNTCK